MSTAIAELQQHIHKGRRELLAATQAWSEITDDLYGVLAELQTLSAAAAEPVVRLASWAAETRDALAAADPHLQDYSARLAGKE